MDLYYHLLSRFYLLQVLPTTSIHSIDATTNVVAANATTTINKIIIIKIKKWSKTMDKNHNQLIFSRRKRHELMMIKQDTEQTKRKGKNTRSLPSAQQSKTEPGERRARLFFKLCKDANGRTTERTTQTRKRQRTSSAREIPTSAMYQRPNSDLTSTEYSREI